MHVQAEIHSSFLYAIHLMHTAQTFKDGQSDNEAAFVCRQYTFSDLPRYIVCADTMLIQYTQAK